MPRETHLPERVLSNYTAACLVQDSGSTFYSTFILHQHLHQATGINTRYSMNGKPRADSEYL